MTKKLHDNECSNKYTNDEKYSVKKNVGAEKNHH